MQLSDKRIDEILQWWREQPFWNKFLFALCHPEEWFDVISLDEERMASARQPSSEV